jgi:lysine N6-hydroxylase
MTQRTPYDLLGVGIGPSNLSLAALLSPLPEFTSCFFDHKNHFDWHAGVMFPDATIQVSFLKDLVTLADPTSRFSFISFLFENKRIYRFLTSNFSRVTRLEFNQYLQWVSNSLDNVKFGCNIDAIDHDGQSFIVCANDERLYANNIVLGTGLTPVAPNCAKRHLGNKNLVVGVEFLTHAPCTNDLRIAIIGGGQTGAEIVRYLISDLSRLPREIHWISRRANFLPLDESPFANELFTPAYSNHFFRLPAEQRLKLLDDHKLASDGINTGVLESIYRTLYELEFLHQRGRLCHFHPSCELVDIETDGREWTLILNDAIRGQTAAMPVDIAILATGFEYRIPHCLHFFGDRIQWGPDGYVLEDDFSIKWDGPADHKIYLQNGARKQRGIADPNLSLLAWRSAIIINSLMKRTVYEVHDANALFNFEQQLNVERVGGD